MKLLGVDTGRGKNQRGKGSAVLGGELCSTEQPWEASWEWDFGERPKKGWGIKPVAMQGGHGKCKGPEAAGNKERMGPEAGFTE